VERGMGIGKWGKRSGGKINKMLSAAHLLHLLAPGDEIAQMKQLHAQFVGPRMNPGGKRSL